MMPLLRGAAAIRVAILIFTLGFIFLTIHWMASSLPASPERVQAGRPQQGRPADDGKTSPALEGVPNPWADDSKSQPPPKTQPVLDDVDSGSGSGSGWHVLPETCSSYSYRAAQVNEPKSKGKFALSYARPEPICRTFNSSLVEETIVRMKKVIADPDLFRVFENTFPNTADTAIKWRGVAANNSKEELTFVITGDIDAMWLRDSANQLQVYRGVLRSPEDDVASLFRGTINLQARYIVLQPYCNAFQAPPESEIPVGFGGGGSTVTPPIDPKVVSTCNFELDSFGAFLQLSEDYYNATGDVAFFGQFQWVYAVQSMLKTARDMMAPTYDQDGKRLEPPYTFWSQTRYMTGTLNTVGTGNPVSRTGMVRSPFRPSDDTSVFEFLVPANMMFARYLRSSSRIMDQLKQAPAGLGQEMRDMATEITEGIEKYGIVKVGGESIYAYEVDGFGGRNLMDDANVPSLLSAPFIGFLDQNDTVYQNTRKFVLSKNNPWYCRGPALNAVGSTHIKPGAGWPMAAVMQIFTTDDDAEIEQALVELISSTSGLGLMHESVNSQSAQDFTRAW
jgi:uncharacterized protein